MLGKHKQSEELVALKIVNTSVIGITAVSRERVGHRHGVQGGWNVEVNAPQEHREDPELFHPPQHAGRLHNGVLRGRRVARVRGRKGQTPRTGGLVLLQTNRRGSPLSPQGKTHSQGPQTRKHTPHGRPVETHQSTNITLIPTLDRRFRNFRSQQHLARQCRRRKLEIFSSRNIFKEKKRCLTGLGIY